MNILIITVMMGGGGGGAVNMTHSFSSSAEAIFESSMQNMKYVATYVIDYLSIINNFSFVICAIVYTCLYR